MPFLNDTILTGRRWAPILLVALLLPSVGAAAAPETGDAGDPLEAFFDEYGIRSEGGWTAGAVEQEENRFLLVQYDETGEVYQLGDLDGAIIENLAWPKDNVLQVTGAHSDGGRFDANIRLERRGDTANFEFIRYNPRGGSGNFSGSSPTTAPAPSSGWRQLQPASEYARWRRGR